MANFYTQDAKGVVSGVLAADVANSGTFDVSYPTGTSQLSFTAGLVGSNGYLVINNNDRWTVAASKVSFSFGASTITVTNSTGATLAAGSSYILNFDIQDGNDIEIVTLPVSSMASIASGDVVTEIRPGIAGTIEYWEWVQGVPVTTASKLATLNLEIDTTNVTGGTIALTSAACTPIGKVIAGSAITAANTLTKESKLSVEASSVTAFVEGSGYVLIHIRRS